MGKVSKGARVGTNDSSATNLSIKFTAQVIDFPDTTFALNLNPTQLDFTPEEGKERNKLSTQIQNISQTRVKIEPVGYPRDLFKVRLSDSDLRPGEKTKLMVKLNRRMELNKFQKSITFELNDQKNSRFTVPVKKDPPPAKRSTKRPPTRKSQGG